MSPAFRVSSQAFRLRPNHSRAAQGTLNQVPEVIKRFDVLVAQIKTQHVVGVLVTHGGNRTGMVAGFELKRSLRPLSCSTIRKLLWAAFQ